MLVSRLVSFKIVDLRPQVILLSHAAIFGFIYVFFLQLQYYFCVEFLFFQQLQLQRERLMLDRMNKAFRKSENQLIAVLERRRAEIKVRSAFPAATLLNYLKRLTLVKGYFKVKAMYKN